MEWYWSPELVEGDMGVSRERQSGEQVYTIEHCQPRGIRCFAYSCYPTALQVSRVQCLGWRGWIAWAESGQQRALDRYLKNVGIRKVVRLMGASPALIVRWAKVFGRGKGWM